MNRPVQRNFLPAIMIFLILNSGFLLLMKRLETWGFDFSVLVFGNIIVFATSLLSYWMAVKGLTTKNNYAFLFIII